MNASKTAQMVPHEAPSLLAKMAQRYTVEPAKMLATLKATAFRGDVNNEQMMALLIVADQYNLNPWLRQIYAFPDTRNGIVPVVGVDGWTRIINEHPQFDGLEFKEADCADGDVPAWIECVIYRKDRAHPIAAREYFEEVRRDTSPWKSHPRRMLRHKALIQCARMAFGFAGIYDPDEAEHVIQAEMMAPKGKPVVAMPQARSKAAAASEPVAEVAQDVTPATTDPFIADMETAEARQAAKETGHAD